MRTTITIDDDLVFALEKITGARSRSAAISLAAVDYVRRAKLKEFLNEWEHVRVEDVSGGTRDADQRRSRLLDQIGE